MCVAVRNSVILSVSMKSSVGHSMLCREARSHKAPWHGLLTKSEVFCGPDELV